MDKRTHTSHCIGEIRNLAGAISKPVIVLSQLNRDAAKTGVASVANLAESSSVENDSDFVVIMMQDNRAGKLPEDHIFNVAKARQGKSSAQRSSSTATK